MPARSGLALVLCAGCAGLAVSGTRGEGPTRQDATLAAGGTAEPAARGPEVQRAAAAPQEQFAPSYLLVKTKPGVRPVVDDGQRWSFTAPDGDVAAAALAEVLTRRNVRSITPAFTIEPANAALESSLGLDRWFAVHVPDQADVRDFAAELATFDNWFEHAQPDALGTLAETTPDDPDFGLQYALKNSGQPVAGQMGVAGADVKATFAWDITTGSHKVVIAVLDAGANEHEDLPDALVPGWNTYENGPDTTAICGSHGMHVSGIAAARGNNGIGVAGMNWEAKIMPVVVVSDACNGTATDAADGVMWAANHGADIISMSLQYYAEVDMLYDAVLYARALGIVVIAAAGNNNIIVAWPGAFEETICVAATDNRDMRATFSNPGPELTVAAPGDDIYSTKGFTDYGYISGTSMAAPLVSGLAALMLAQDPTLTHDEIQDILINTADDVEATGFDENTGHGRVNAHAALISTNLWRADLDDDHDVDVADLLLVLGHWGNCNPNEPLCEGDANFDGVVNVQDLLIVLGAWGYQG